MLDIEELKLTDEELAYYRDYGNWNHAVDAQFKKLAWGLERQLLPLILSGQLTEWTLRIALEDDGIERPETKVNA